MLPFDSASLVQIKSPKLNLQAISGHLLANWTTTVSSKKHNCQVRYNEVPGDAIYIPIALVVVWLEPFCVSGWREKGTRGNVKGRRHVHPLRFPLWSAREIHWNESVGFTFEAQISFLKIKLNSHVLGESLRKSQFMQVTVFSAL